MGRKRVVAKVAGTVVVNSFQALVRLAVAGRGIARAADFLGAEDVARGRLVRLLCTFQPPPVPIHIVYPSSRLLSTSLRAFVDFLTGWEFPDPALP